MSAQTLDEVRLHGYLAEFATPEQLRRGIERTREAGFVHYDAFSPYPDEELAHAMGIHGSKLPWIVFAGGALGGFTGWLLQYWSSTMAYPMNIGGRPFNSWPAFIVVIFEMTILFAAFAAVLGMFRLNDMPKPYHPLFNVERFALATRDRFFLFIEVEDDKFDEKQTWEFLEGLSPSEVTAVED